MAEDGLNTRHTQKMIRKKLAHDRIVAGKGKGKSTAGFGMVLRALGHGMKIGVVQSIKGVRDPFRSGVKAQKGIEF